MLRGSEAGVLSPVSHPWRGKQTTDPVTGLLRFTGSSLRSVLYFKDIALHELVMGWVTHTFYFFFRTGKPYLGRNRNIWFYLI